MTQAVPLTTQQTGIPMEPQQSDESSIPEEATTDPSSSAVMAQPPDSPATGTKPNWALKLPENPLLALFAALLAVLLGLAFTLTNDRISSLDDHITRLEDKVDAGFARIDERFEAQDAKFEARFEAQDAKFEARFEAQDAKFEARFEAQDVKLDEINLKLTALIAALNATAGVEAALDGRLLDPDSPPDSQAAN